MATVLKFVLVLFVVLYLDSCKSDNLVIGTNSNVKLAYDEKVKLSSIPFYVRKKDVFYSGNQIIRGISAIDMANTKSKATVTAGGVGFTFTNIKLRSERGNELNYQIQIFV